MARKLRIAILYNEPIVGTEEGRKYISENGQLQEGGKALKSSQNQSGVGPGDKEVDRAMIDDLEGVFQARGLNAVIKGGGRVQSHQRDSINSAAHNMQPGPIHESQRHQHTQSRQT